MQIGSRILFVLILLLPLTAFAAPGGAHSNDIPWKTIGVQLFNFAFLMSLLIYLTKKTVVEHFLERHRTYKELVSKAEVAKNEAATTHREISNRLNALKSTSKDNAEKARAEALELKQRLLTEAKEISAKLKIDAQKTAEIELQKAKNELQHYALSEALKSAEQKLTGEPGFVDHSRLQSEFIEKIQAVSQ